ncbi:hypothetical protein DFH09DRAFT_1109452 [Mycena vulgaris]|nr:hypothetical protein DFH09DRAFT_1109452 [Mycena vulgaris]
MSQLFLGVGDPPSLRSCASVTQALIVKFGDRMISVVWVVAEVLRRWVYLRSVRIKSAPSIVNLQHEDPKIPQVLQDVSRDARHTCPSTRRDSRGPIRGDKGSRKAGIQTDEDMIPDRGHVPHRQTAVENCPRRTQSSISRGYSHRPVDIGGA